MKYPEGQAELPLIRTITSLVKRGEVPVPSTSVPVYAMGDGEFWVAKNGGSGEVLAEALGWLLAGRLRVPTAPRVAVYLEGGQVWWLSGLVEGVNEWKSSDAFAIVNADALGRMMLLDVVMLNTDRHSRNILIINDGQGPRVVAIDMGGAEIAGGAAAANPLTPLDISRLAPGVVRPVVERGMRGAIGHLSKIDDNALHQMCAVAVQAAGLHMAKADEIAEVLIARRDASTELTDRFLADLDAREIA